MNVLGIETSCDETAVAVVRDGHNVTASLVSSQVAKHADYGGVIPELAAREHLKALRPILQQTLHQAELALDDIDAVTVTSSPGLLPALLVGLSFAKGLAAATAKPLVGINHFLAHVFGAFLETPDRLQLPEAYPLLTLVVSGGHTALLLTAADGSCKLLGQTLDDAAGEAFDKAAKILQLPYPGGPVIDKLGKVGNPAACDFPRGLCGGGGQALKPKNRLNFSFSGVKTALLYQVKGVENAGNLDQPLDLADDAVADIAASYQEAIVDALVKKTLWALADTGARTVALSGGVACNSRLRQKMADAVKVPLFIAPPKYCTDNAAMVAGLGYYYVRAGRADDFSIDAAPRLGDVSMVPFALGA